MTVTQGTIEGVEDERTGQVSAYREPEPSTRLCIKQVRRRDGAYFASVKCRPMAEGEAVVEREAPDPTKDKAFIRPAYRVHDFMYSSDLSFSTVDDLLPEAQRRVVLVRMMGFEDKAHNLVRRNRDAVHEMSHFGEYDYLVINDDFERAATALVAIVTASRLRRAVQVQRHADMLRRLVAP